MPTLFSNAHAIRIVLLANATAAIFLFLRLHRFCSQRLSRSWRPYILGYFSEATSIDRFMEQNRLLDLSLDGFGRGFSFEALRAKLIYGDHQWVDVKGLRSDQNSGLLR